MGGKVNVGEDYMECIATSTVMHPSTEWGSCAFKLKHYYVAPIQLFIDVPRTKSVRVHLADDESRTCRLSGLELMALHMGAYACSLRIHVLEATGALIHLGTYGMMVLSYV